MHYRDKVLLTLFALMCFVVFLLSHNQRMTAKPQPESFHKAMERKYGEAWDTPIVELTNEEKALACQYSRECAVLAEAVVYEARSESLLGQYAVAEVIMNRVAAKRWPNTISGVVYQKHQFEYITNKHKQKKPTKKDWRTAYIVAYNVKHRLIENITNSDHYLNPKVVKRMPNWTRVYRYTMTIGNHQFYASN